MRCLVTGATGFVGGTLSLGLKACGHDVVGCARTTDAAKRFAGLEVARFELGEPNALAQAARGCEAMVHAAGIADPTADAELLGWTHVAGTENALNAAKAAGCEVFVYISCADVTLYNGPRSFWNEDQAPSRPFGAHATTKLAAEELVRVSSAGAFRTIVLRPALVWGPGDQTHLPGWRKEADRGGVRLIAGGKHLMATTYTRNLVAAAGCALRAGVPAGSIYYVVDTELSLAREFFTQLSEALHWIPPRRGAPYSVEWTLARLGLSSLHPTEVIRRGHTSAFEATRAKSELGYEPVATREEGMRELAAWVEESPAG